MLARLAQRSALPGWAPVLLFNVADAIREVTTSAIALSPPVPTVAQDAERYAADAPKTHATINGRPVEVPEGTSILHAAAQLGLYIPTLCTHPRLPTTPGTCRLCLVEADGGKLVPACATPLTENMHVSTDTPAVRESVRGTLSLLKADHPLDCMNCDADGRCEFQSLIRRYNVTDDLPSLRAFSHEWDEEVQSDFEALHMSPDAAAPTTHAIDIDLEKCLRCGRCVTACGLVQEMNVLGWAGRGRERHPAVLSDALDLSKCIECGQCSSVCPVGAIRERSEWRQVLDELETKRKVMVAVTAPAVRVAIGEEVGLAPGSATVGQMVAAQRALGFDYVLDVDFAADLTIMEEGTELLQRVKAAWGLSEPAEGHHAPGPLPMFTSCCPGWITLVEKSYPELIPHLSTCKSPQQMMGAVVKRHFASRLNVKPEDICLVSFMPCTAKKSEAEREEVNRPGEPRDIDYVLTTREFGHLLRLKNVPLASLEESSFDSPLGASTGAAVIFGATGGVMEAALRTAYELLVEKPLPKLDIQEVRGLRGVKYATVRLPDDAPPAVAGKEIKVAVASGIGNARHMLQAMAEGTAPEAHFIEVMACPGGCIGGGGQPKTKDPAAILKRMGAIYSLDERSTLRKSHENPEVQALYEDFLQAPGGELSHELLHTHYTDRSHATLPAYTVAERRADVEESAKKVSAAADGSGFKVTTPSGSASDK